MSFNSKETYWNNNGKYQADYDRLISLVPPMGKCETLEGEMLRAASKIGYDYCNNGWGCNNWSGAVEFLKEHMGIPRWIREVLDEYSTGARCTGQTYDDNDLNYHATNALMDLVLEKIKDVKEFTPNDEDMLDYDLPDCENEYTEDW